MWADIEKGFQLSFETGDPRGLAVSGDSFCDNIIIAFILSNDFRNTIGM